MFCLTRISADMCRVRGLVRRGFEVSAISRPSRSRGTEDMDADRQRAEARQWATVMDTPARKMGETASLLEQARAAHAGVEGRLEGAEKLKAQANDAFRQKQHALAIRSYLSALWMLRLDDPALPRALTEPAVPAGEALLATLLEAMPAADQREEARTSELEQDAPRGETDEQERSEGSEQRHGDGDGVAPAQQESAESAEGCDSAGGGESAALLALRMALLVNAAAAALELEEWGTARRACEAVLATTPTHVKALYRLARAHDGAGRPSAALSVLQGRLLKHDPANAQALALVTKVRARVEREKAMYGGLFDRAQGARDDADSGLYSDNALQAEAERKAAEKEVSETASACPPERPQCA